MRTPPLILAAVLAMGCYRLRPSSGGGQAWFRPPRGFDAADIAVPSGYRAELVASGLTFPTGVAFDDDDRPYVVEAGYSAGEAWATPRLLKLEGGRWTPVATGGRNGPWNGVAYSSGAFYVAEGSVLEGGRILRVGKDGSIETLVDGLPTRGDYHASGPVLGPDGALYFGVGTATNSGVVGEDNIRAGWAGRFPGLHDVPCQDLALAGRNFEAGHSSWTGAFLPYGTPSVPGQLVYGAPRCNGALYRLDPGGARLAPLAWGLREPFGLAFSTAGALYAVDQGYEQRGSRPVWGAGDLVWRIEPGRWYGWPDFSGDRPLFGAEFRPPHGKAIEPLLAHWPNAPPAPVSVLAVHAGSSGIDFCRNPAFGYAGQAFLAQFGDLAPVNGKVLHPVGFKVVRLDVETGVAEDFAVNRGRRNGPASKLGAAGLERPIAARFDRTGLALYVVDFGVVTTSSSGPVPYKGSGALWRITRAETAGAAPKSAFH